MYGLRLAPEGKLKVRTIRSVDESDTAVSPRPSSGLPLPSASIHQVTPAHSAHASGDQALESHAEEDASAAIRILVATDNHIGYAEKDPVRGRDSINTFREILSIAIKEDVRPNGSVQRLGVDKTFAVLVGRHAPPRRRPVP